MTSQTERRLILDYLLALAAIGRVMQAHYNEYKKNAIFTDFAVVVFRKKVLAEACSAALGNNCRIL